MTKLNSKIIEVTNRIIDRSKYYRKRYLDNVVAMEDDNDNELQSIYRSMFPKNHPIVGHPSRIGARFLSKNAWLLN